MSKIAYFDGEKDYVFASSARTFSYRERINNRKTFACLRTSYSKCSVVSEIDSWDRGKDSSGKTGEIQKRVCSLVNGMEPMLTSWFGKNSVVV